MKKNWLKIFLIISLFQSSSCAYFFNDKEVELSISSNPPGADIFIEGQNYGKTPKMLRIEPKNYNVVLELAGYGSTNLQLKTWQTIRNRDRDGERCILDSMGFMFILPLLSMWSVYCRDFKEKNHFINIPQNNTGLNRPLPNNFYEINKSYQEQQNYHIPEKIYYNQNNASTNNIDPSITNHNKIDNRNMQQSYDPFLEENLHYNFQKQYRYNSYDLNKQRVAPQRNYMDNPNNRIGEYIYQGAAPESNNTNPNF